MTSDLDEKLEKITSQRMRYFSFYLAIVGASAWAYLMHPDSTGRWLALFIAVLSVVFFVNDFLILVARSKYEREKSSFTIAPLIFVYLIIFFVSLDKSDAISNISAYFPEKIFQVKYEIYKNASFLVVSFVVSIFVPFIVEKFKGGHNGKN